MYILTQYCKVINWESSSKFVTEVAAAVQSSCSARVRAWRVCETDPPITPRKSKSAHSSTNFSAGSRHDWSKLNSRWIHGALLTASQIELLFLTYRLIWWLWIKFFVTCKKFHRLVRKYCYRFHKTNMKFPMEKWVTQMAINGRVLTADHEISTDPIAQNPFWEVIFQT